MSEVQRGRLVELAESDQWRNYCSAFEDESMRLAVAGVLENTKRMYHEGLNRQIPEELLYSFSASVMRNVSMHEIASFQPASHAVSPVFFTSREMSEDENGVPECNIRLESRPIVATDDQIAVTTQWSMQLERHLRGRHDISMEIDMFSNAARELAAGIDSKILREMWDGAGISLESEIEDAYGIVDASIKATGEIMTKTGTAHENAMIMSTFLYENLLRSAQREVFIPESGIWDRVFVRRVGKMLGRWNVYENPYFNDTDVLFCSKGFSWFDSGYIFVPFGFSIRCNDQLESLSRRQAFSLLYGASMVNPDNFCKYKLTIKKPGVRVEELERPKFYRKLNIQYD